MVLVPLLAGGNTVAFDAAGGQQIQFLPAAFAVKSASVWPDAVGSVFDQVISTREEIATRAGSRIVDEASHGYTSAATRCDFRAVASSASVSADMPKLLVPVTL